MIDVRHITTFTAAEKFIDEMYGNLNTLFSEIDYNQWERRYEDVQAAVQYLKRRGIYWEERDSEPWYI